MSEMIFILPLTKTNIFASLSYMKKLILATKQNFELSSGRTPQYLAWHKLFKREFTAFLKSIGVTDIKVSKPNHFDASGFFKLSDGRIFYFSISDLRWFKDTMLVRTAKDFSDYTGGQNHNITLDNDQDFIKELLAVFILTNNN